MTAIEYEWMLHPQHGYVIWSMKKGTVCWVVGGPFHSGMGEGWLLDDETVPKNWDFA